MLTPLGLGETRALIVGGTSGVGLATAKRLAAAGTRRIALVGRDKKRGMVARQAVLGVAPDAIVTFIAADARQFDEAQRVVEEAALALGGIDALINSTSTAYAPELFFRTLASDMAPLIADLVSAPMNMCRAAIDVMRAQNQGVIVNIASDAAKVPTPGETVIGAAMAAIVMFSRTLALEAKRDGIRVHALTPSLIKGTTTEQNVTREGFGAKLFARAADQAHLGVANPDDIAAAIEFLIGPGAARMTGQVISVNGGISVA